MTHCSPLGGRSALGRSRATGCTEAGSFEPRVSKLLDCLPEQPQPCPPPQSGLLPVSRPSWSGVTTTLSPRPVDPYDEPALDSRSCDPPSQFLPSRTPRCGPSWPGFTTVLAGKTGVGGCIV